MKKILMILLLILLPACRVQKHMEVERRIESNSKVDVTERTDRNTIRFIVITKYKDSMDSLGNQQIESVTEIKELNNDKVTTETKEENNEHAEENISMDSKTEPSYKWYIICFCSGIVLTLLVIGIIRFIVWYIKKKK